MAIKTCHLVQKLLGESDIHTHTRTHTHTYTRVHKHARTHITHARAHTTIRYHKTFIYYNKDSGPKTVLCQNFDSSTWQIYYHWHRRRSLFLMGNYGKL